MWRGDLVTEYKRKFLRPESEATGPEHKLGRMMNQTHFTLGDTPTDYSRPEFAVAKEKPARAVDMNQLSSVPFSGPAEPFTTVSRDTYKGATGEAPPRCKPIPGSVLLGTDADETKTTQRESYKRIAYVDCMDLTDVELRERGLVRFKVEDVPDHFKDTDDYKKAIQELQTLSTADLNEQGKAGTLRVALRSRGKS